MNKKRGSFSGGLGFVFAAAGSAVGLGNLWRFPYLAAQYGGGIFLLVYLILAVTFGFALLTAEIAIGRKTKLSPVLAYKKLNKKFSFLGYIATLVPIIIIPYYCVIGGWVTKYVTVYAQGLVAPVAKDGYFSDFIGHPVAPLVFFLIFMLISIVVIMLGVKKGIEKLSKFLMPLLVVLTIGIAIYALTLPNAMEGVKYYLIPDFSKFSILTVAGAMSQLFYSMSIAMGIMVTYGSYTRDDVNLNKSVNRIEFFDTLVALLAGLMIIPAVYIFSGEEGLSSQGAGLMFMTLPKVFQQMPGGNIIALLFFVLVFFAAITSSISVMEAIVSSLMDKFHLKRIPCCLIVIGICLLLGIPSSLGNGLWANIKILGMDFLTFFDYISNSILMPIVAFCTCILVGWVIKPKALTDEITKNGEKFGRKKLFNVMIKYIAPICLLFIFVTGILSQLGIITI
ncbi:MAG: sodium-dependent transporter [Ruminococcus sp.]|nr:MULTISPECIES: sodium-dependent transporter [Ruminococcus]MCI5597766.1 sodium-dependent transporter [Ruminococcus sp.]MCI5618087.1 sodium-dependent transporter [Ruminococcus sp.]MCI6505442.1 sodium-dependent transporter [Ruminococcus sp.]MDD5890801.1 sodium-dependent transporter [Ruminococcus sp.]MDD6531028.1 sodium-dependent transporter [Ruminococcus sp.]